MPLIVHAPGPASLLVDYGRPGMRSLGVSIGGAADRRSLALGNALVGNPVNAVGLEFALAGPTVEATDTHGCVVAGAPFDILLNGRSWPIGKTFTMHPGDVLSIGTPRIGLRGYLCVSGGFTSPKVLGSGSAWELLRITQELPCPTSSLRPRFLVNLRWLPEELEVLRLLPGSHAALFAGQDFWSRPYEVTSKSDRMGLRLSGEPLVRAAGELVSAPVCPGTVQVTNDGQTIVLGVDAQTIGGYPRLAQVIRADLDKLGQLRPGSSVRWQQVDLKTAEALQRQANAELHEWVVRLQNSLV